MALHYRLGNSWCWVEGGSPSRIDRLDDLLSTDMGGFQYSWKMRRLISRGILDGKIHLYDALRKRFPAGLLPYVQQEIGGKVTEDERGKPLKIFSAPYGKCLRGIKLVDWQLGAAREAIKKERGYLKMATNAGKTATAATACWAFDEPILYLVHRVNLMDQTADALEGFLGRKVGRIGDKRQVIEKETVAMVQSIQWRKKKWKDLLATFRGLIIDEAHHTSATTWYNVAQACTSARFRIGMSGTPLHNDKARDLKLMGATGSDLLYKVLNEQLIDVGWSAKPIIHLHKFKAEENGLPWDEAYKSLLNDPTYNLAVIDEVSQYAEKGYSILVLTDRISHGMLLRDMLSGRGYEARFLSGQDPSSWRKAKLESLRRKELQILVATTIFDEGIDAPAINCLAMASAGKSPRQLLQRIGRALRKKKEGKNEAHILDWVPMTNYYLLAHALERQQIYQEEGFDVIRK